MIIIFLAKFEQIHPLHFYNNVFPCISNWWTQKPKQGPFQMELYCFLNQHCCPTLNDFIMCIVQWHFTSTCDISNTIIMLIAPCLLLINELNYSSSNSLCQFVSPCMKKTETNIYCYYKKKQNTFGSINLVINYSQEKNI